MVAWDRSRFGGWSSGSGHSETPCLAILNKQNIFYSETENRKVKQALSGIGTNGRRKDIRKG
jgi:hypothetical protein